MIDVTSIKSPETTAQRFYSQGKRIPKDVKRHCGMCKQHGFLVETRGHNCTFKNCTCEQCDLVRKRREIMSTQIRLRREQDKKFQRTNDASEADIVPWNATTENGELKFPENVNMCYFCQKCKNHGILMWKKDHKKKCQFMDCRCEQCDLIDSRRALDRHIKKRKLNHPKTKSETKSPRKDESCSSEESSSSSSSSDSSLCGSRNSLLPPSAVSIPRSPLATNATSSPSYSPTNSTSPFPPIPATTFNFPQFVPPMVPNSVAGLLPFFNSTLAYCGTNLIANPFLMTPFTPIDMQLLFSNLQNLSEMKTAVTLANTD
ncbi:unnamed protein product [Caenorhabditis bovis]|uniref:DM domain-containing protein n=1 Tax=Caenorhabditis bovis TaxID=2654633 RepID=A0A8S1EBJ0_9PELO|nr:unnamed protein product [Caenorhabditis bovis]